MQRGAIVLAVCTLLACGDDAPQSALVGTWRVVAYEERDPGEDWHPPKNVACRLDDVEEFEDGGAWTLYVGLETCGPGGPPGGVARGLWELTANDTKLVFWYDDALGKYEKTVEMLSESRLIVSHATGLTSGTQARATYQRVE